MGTYLLVLFCTLGVLLALDTFGNETALAAALHINTAPEEERLLKESIAIFNVCPAIQGILILGVDHVL
jgi:hypothetical protein